MKAREHHYDSQFCLLKEKGPGAVGESTVARPLKRVVHLVPRFGQKLKAAKTQTREIKQWTSDGVEELRGCFESTERSVFFDSCSSHHELDVSFTDYFRFCEDCVITSKSEFFRTINHG